VLAIVDSNTIQSISSSLENTEVGALVSSVLNMTEAVQHFPLSHQSRRYPPRLLPLIRQSVVERREPPHS